LGFLLTPASHNGIFEPGDHVDVERIRVQNTGGMLPQHIKRSCCISRCQLRLIQLSFPGACSSKYHIPCQKAKCTSLLTG
jgi:hypothetical protein